MRRPPSIYLCALMVSATACEGKFGYRLEQPLEGRIPLSAAVQGIRVELLDGDVTFVAGDPGGITFSGMGMKAADSPEELASIESEFMGLAAAGMTDGVLLLRGPREPEGAEPGQFSLALRLVVHVPPELALDVSARSGNLAAIEMRAPVSLQTRRGMLNLSNQRGPGVLRSGNGDIIVDGHRGDLDVETAAGKLFAWVVELGPSGVTLVTKDGPIQARLPDEASFQLDAEAEEGKVANEYGIPVGRSDDFVSTMGGTVGEGGPPVVMRATQGRISLRRIGETVENPLPVLLGGFAGVLLLAAGLVVYSRCTARRTAS